MIEGRTGIARSARPSQAETMWELLQDGHWHTNAELLEHGVGRPNSRAAELRKRHGADIRHDHDLNEERPLHAHAYRLVKDLPMTDTGQLLLVAA